MSERRRITVLALLACLHAAAAVLLAPVDVLEPESLAGYAKFAVIGVFLTPPALLAFCAVLGPWPSAIRLPLTVWILCVFALLLAYSALRGDFGYGLASDPSELLSLCIVAPLVEFLILLASLTLLRAVRRWRLEATSVDLVRASESASLSTSSAPRRSSGQYTIRALLGWTLAAASVFAGLRRLFVEQEVAGDEWGEMLLGAAAEGAFTGVVFVVAALPALSIAWLLLASGRRLALRFGLVVFTAGGIAAVLAGIWQMDHDVRSLLAMAGVEVGAIAAGLASVAVIRACGYRLVRRPRANAFASKAVEPPVSWPQGRCAWASAGLAVAAIALACCVPARLGVWRQAAESRRWAALGLQVQWGDDQGSITCALGSADRLTNDDLRRIAELPDLAMLEFRRLRDSQLAALVAPATLESLHITDSRFTNKGLQYLDRFPQVTDLDLSRTSVTDEGLVRIASLKRLFRLSLSMTDVTDDGLAALEQCGELRSIDLSLTAVTAAGARRLSAALPEAAITIGACDAVVRSAVRQASGAARRERLHARGKYQSFGRSRARTMPGGALLTDAGLKALNANMELKDLDLRDTAITDAGLPALFGLKTLERVDLRDTAVTETGRRRLASALPACEILR